MKLLAPAAPALLYAVLLAACSGAPTRPTPPAAAKPATAVAASPTPDKRSPYAPAQEDHGKRGDYIAGGLYAPHIADSAPDDLPDVEAIPEPAVIDEPRSRYGNRGYSVLGKRYEVMAASDGYVEQGLASYYGKKFHGRRTSSLEVYDMYTFSAAHKTLPLPSYARVTNLANGKSVVVRVNDRGPFHAGRIIDLSYAAAVKLGVHRAGVAKVEVQAFAPGAAALGATVAGKTRGTAISAPSMSQPTVLDRVVAALPLATANPGGHLPVATAEVKPVPAGSWRFDMRQDGKAMTAAEFDAWMQSRQVRVATGKPSAAPAAPLPPAPPPATTPLRANRATVLLQVASFAARVNGERALAMLQDAGIDNARLLDAVAAGQKVWRLRIGPVDDAAAVELSSRVRGLGFGPPNIVRD